MLTPERLAEAAENLAIIQDHARIFLASPLAAEAAQDGED
jgi:hypothetical protein